MQLNNHFYQRFVYFACILIVATVVGFELFASSGVEDGLRKKSQFQMFSNSSILFGEFVHSIAQYIHDKTPFLEHVPYATLETDSRLSTWYIPPHQVVIQWMFYGGVFAITMASGLPKARFVNNKINTDYALISLLIITLLTLVAVVYYKIRAWIQLGEWFALVYLLQPCHVLIAGYTVLLFDLIQRQRVTGFSNSLMNILFDLQWCTIVAIALPDTEALLARDFAGELFLFWFEHFLLVILPYICMGNFFKSSSHQTWQSRLHRAWFSACIFGIHHMHVMTPVSLIGGVQVNYQTHLPKYALGWFGKWYKTAVLWLAFVGICMFSFVVEPAWKRIVNSNRTKIN